MSLSHLTVGTARIPTKPPRSTPPCEEPVTYGANILDDPGFELQLANFGGGPEGDEIPGFLGSVEFWWTDGSDGPPDSHWSQGYSGITTQRWKIVTTDPRSGTYHAQTQTYSDNQSVVNLYPHGFFTCEGVNVDVGARVEPGDYYEWSIWVKVSHVVTAPVVQQHQANLRIQFFDSDGDANADATNVSAAVDMTTSYQQLSLTGFVPASMIYMRPYLISNFGDGTIDNATVFRADDAVWLLQT